MNSTTHEPDDRLLQELASALDATDPVPERFIEAAKESFTWRTIDIELAGHYRTDTLNIDRGSERNRRIGLLLPGRQRGGIFALRRQFAAVRFHSMSN